MKKIETYNDSVEFMSELIARASVEDTNPTTTVSRMRSAAEVLTRDWDVDWDTAYDDVTLLVDHIRGYDNYEFTYVLDLINS